MANNIHPAIGHTGGGTGALDAIDGDDLTDGDGALVVTDHNADHYVVDGSSSESESYPRIIAPDTNPGTKRYKRIHCRDQFLYSRKASADTPDDEFETTTLDGKWTTVGAPVSGTVDLLETGNVDKYDLATRPGWLLIQAYDSGGLSSGLRQDYTLPDGSSITLAVAIGMGHDDALASSQRIIGLALNSDDASAAGSTYYQVRMDPNIGSNSIKAFGDGITTTTSGEGILSSRMVYFRIARSGLTYYGFYSFDGFTWCGMGSKTASSAFNNIWIFYITNANDVVPAGIFAVPWIRQGTNNLDPWGI